MSSELDTRKAGLQPSRNNGNRLKSRVQLEEHFSKLKYSWIVCRRNSAEGAGGDLRGRTLIVCPILSVETLSAELQPPALGETEILEQRHIHIEIIWVCGECPGQSYRISQSGRHGGRGVEVLADA